MTRNVLCSSIGLCPLWLFCDCFSRPWRASTTWCSPPPHQQPTPAPTLFQGTLVRPLRPANELEARVEAAYSDAAPAVANITSHIITHHFFMQPAHEEGTGSAHSPLRGDGEPVNHTAESGKGPSLVIELG